ncbi:MAG: hypothetical protein LBO73_00865 [Holosporaceae bacterium]|nr:hypothetical protein [Holosporaceae bacterium]
MIIAGLQLTVAFVGLLAGKKTDDDKYDCLLMILSAFTAAVATFSLISQISAPISRYFSFFDFVALKNIRCGFGLLSDSLSIVSSWVICVATAIINCYSLGYMRKNSASFLFYLNLLSLTAILFVSSGNLLQMYIFWEALSVISGLLISSDEKNSSAESAVKTIAFHKFGDVGLLIATASLVRIFGSFDLNEINKFFVGNDSHLRKLEVTAIIAALSIFVKSLRIESTAGLKNTSDEPIPGVALMHSSTLMTAGVFLMIRLQSLFECSEFVQNTTAAIGLLCAVIYGVKAVFAGDVSEILLCSTRSQVGFMLAACGLSAYGAAVTLFVTHAFSKLSLILAVGSAVYSLSGERDLRNMGGLFELLPKTYISFVLAAVSLVGIPLLPSYYAGKILLNEIIVGNSLMCRAAPLLIIAVSILTSICLFRLIRLIFHGEVKTTETGLAYLNENNNFVIYSLYVSVFFAIFSGVFFYYALYGDVIWTDIFAFSHGENGYATFIFSVVNFIGVIAALSICNFVKLRDAAPESKSEIPAGLKRIAADIIRNFDVVFYRKCWLAAARKIRSEKESTDVRR